MERKEPSEQLKRVLEEVGLNTELCLQRLLFALWMSEDYTLDEIVSNNQFHATLVVPYNTTLQRGRKLWLENDLQDSRSGSSKPRDLVHSAVLEEFAKDPGQSASQIPRRLGMAAIEYPHGVKHATLMREKVDKKEKGVAKREHCFVMAHTHEFYPQEKRKDPRNATVKDCSARDAMIRSVCSAVSSISHIVLDAPLIQVRL